MEGHVSPGSYKDVVLFLATAGVVVPLFRRWRISPILGFLVAGVLLGPHVLGRLAHSYPSLGALTVDNPDEIAQLAEFGVVFLLFTIGLELSWERLKRMRRYVFGLGASQVLVCACVTGGAALGLGLPIAAALAIGGALALSSTAIVMPILTEQKRQHSVAGRATFSVLLFQDLAVAPILVTLTVVGRGGGDQPILSLDLLKAFAPAVIGIVVLLGLGRLLLRPMLRSVAKAKSEELFVAACLLVVIGAGLLSAITGLSMALGAFIAGLLLAETEFRHEVERTIEPFKGLLLGLFFLSVGISLNLPLLVANPLQIVGAALGFLCLNSAVVFVLARLFGLPTRNAAEAALLLAGAGEFAFVIIGQAMAQGLTPPALSQSILVAATLSMICIPFLAMLGARIGGRRTTPPELPVAADAAAEGERRVLVVGYGRVGKLVGEMLRRHDIPWAAVEQDARLVEAGRRAGEAIFFGDASRSEFLQRCGLADAPALVVTMDNPEGAEAVVAVARELRPDLVVVARARDSFHAQRLYELGATDAVPETVEASLQLSEAVLVDIGVPMGLVIASIHERRDEFRAALNRPDSMGGRTRRFRRGQGA